jgi:hypothetical protein
LSLKTEVENRLRAQLDEERRKAETEFAERQAAIAAQAQKELEDRAAVEAAEAEDRKRREDAEMAQRLSRYLTTSYELNGEAVEFFVDNRERNRVAVGASMEALSLAAPCGLYGVWNDKQPLRNPKCPDAFLAVCVALARMAGAQTAAERAAREAERRRQRDAALDRLAMSDTEYAAMMETQRKLEG